MKSTKKVLLMSAATIAMSASLIAGATFALFTSESSTNIAINAGKVDVKATVGPITTYSVEYTDGEYVYTPTQTQGVFTNGGTAGFSDGEVLELTDITPGDKAEFDIELENNSTVSIKYQTQISAIEDDGLLSGLEVVIGDAEIKTAGTTAASAWSEVIPANEAIENIHVSVTLPWAAGNDYQGKSCKLVVTVYAVQGNAHTTDPVPSDEEDPDTTYIYNYAELVALRDAVNAGTWDKKNVELMADIDLGGEAWTPIGVKKADAVKVLKVNFNGNGQTISNMTVNGDYAGFFGYTENSKFENVNFANVKIDGGEYAAALGGNLYTSSIDNVHVKGAVISAYHWGAGIVGSVYGSITNCSAEDLTVTVTPNTVDGKFDNGDKVGGIAGQVQDSGSYRIVGNTVKNATLTAYRDIGGVVGCGVSPDKTYIDNTVEHVSIIVDRTNHYVNSEGKEYAFNAGEIVGRGIMLDGSTGNVTNDVTITYKATNASALQEALVNAEEGSTIELSAGAYTAIDFSAAKNLKNVTLVGKEGTTVAGLTFSTGVTTAASIDGLTIENIAFTAKVDINTSSTSTTITNVKFVGCSFNTGDKATTSGVGLRYYNERNDGAVSNLTVEDCTFENCYQGVYTQKIHGVTVTGCSFKNLGHNAIAVQSGIVQLADGQRVDQPVNHGDVVLKNNTFEDIHERVIRFGNVAEGTNIVITGNVVTNCGDDEGQLMKVQLIEGTITVELSGNTWCNDYTDENVFIGYTA